MLRHGVDHADGIMQDCPASPLILAVLMKTWTMNVQKIDQCIEMTVYLDDRTLWTPTGRANVLNEALKNVTRSMLFWAGT